MALYADGLRCGMQAARHFGLLAIVAVAMGHCVCCAGQRATRLHCAGQSYETPWPMLTTV